MGRQRKRRVDVRVMPAVVQVIASIVALGTVPISFTFPSQILQPRPEITFIEGSVQLGTDRLLQENLDFLLQETNDKILLDAAVVVTGETLTVSSITLIDGAVSTSETSFLLQENNDKLLQENNDRILLDSTVPVSSNALTDAINGDYLLDVINGDNLIGVT